MILCLSTCEVCVLKIATVLTNRNSAVLCDVDAVVYVDSAEMNICASKNFNSFIFDKRSGERDECQASSVILRLVRPLQLVMSMKNNIGHPCATARTATSVMNGQSCIRTYNKLLHFDASSTTPGLVTLLLPEMSRANKSCLVFEFLISIAFVVRAGKNVRELGRFAAAFMALE